MSETAFSIPALPALEGLRFTSLRRQPGLKEQAAAWFHSKWGVPQEAYLDCMEACLSGETAYDWYFCRGDLSPLPGDRPHGLLRALRLGVPLHGPG